MARHQVRRRVLRCRDDVVETEMALSHIGSTIATQRSLCQETKRRACCACLLQALEMEKTRTSYKNFIYQNCFPPQPVFLVELLSSHVQRNDTLPRHC